MKLRYLLNEGISRLKSNNIEDSDFDAKTILLSVFDMTYTEFLMKSDSVVDKALSEEYFKKIEQRCSRIPLQYILGSWEFMGLNFSVGEGVLIPRPETELIVEKAIEITKNSKNSVIFDLCSGSGCIGLSIAALVPESNVYMVEKNDSAFKYLKKNHETFNLDNAHIIQDDIFNENSCLLNIEPDIIVSNPPYIKTDDVAGLQQEVRMEPVEALDGGTDGFDFYRLLADKWFARLKDNGMMILECGENQSDYIRELFNGKGIVSVIKDYNNIDRVIMVSKQ